MISMLFGLERARGVAAENDDYIRYMPVNGGNYGGSVTIRKGKTFYRIIRNFSKEQKIFGCFMKTQWKKSICQELRCSIFF